MAEAILVTLRETWSGYVEGLRLVIPRLLAMLSVVVAGWLDRGARPRGHRARPRLAAASARLAERTGTAELLRKAELPPAERLVASAVFWVLFLGFLLAGLDALGFKHAASLRAEVLRLRAAPRRRPRDPRRRPRARQRGLAHRPPGRGERRLAVGAARRRGRLLPHGDDRRGDGARPGRPRAADRARRPSPSSSAR